MRTDKNTLSNYRRFRAIGQTPAQAMRSARILTKWAALEFRGKVRIQAEDEQEDYFRVYGEPDTEEERKGIVEAIERHGLTYVFTEYFSAGEWHHADSIGMCIYERPTDPFDNCYGIDLMGECITQYEKDRQQRKAKKDVKKAKKALRKAKQALKAIA